MRPIDADRLKEKVLKWLPSDPCGIAEKEHPNETDISVSLIMEIEEAPTIEPSRPQGEWERIPYSFAGGYRCSICGEKRLENHFNYCPYCGARMKGANNAD